MSFNGSGTFNRTTGLYTGSTAWQQEASAGYTASASRFDTHDQDVAAGLTGCITKDGQSTPTANIPFGGYRLLNIGDATARTDAAKTSQVQDDAYVWGGTTGGTATAYTLTLTPAISAYTNGSKIRFKLHATNTGAATINVNGLGAKSLSFPSGSCPAGSLQINELYEAVYETTLGGYYVNNTLRGNAIANWSPSYAASGAMTYTSVTTDLARYTIKGSEVTVFFRFTGTTGGTASTNITFTLPFASASLGGSPQWLNACYVSEGTSSVGFVSVNDNSSTANIIKSDTSNFGLGASRLFIGTLSYLRA